MNLSGNPECREGYVLSAEPPGLAPGTVSSADELEGEPLGRVLKSTGHVVRGDPRWPAGRRRGKERRSPTADRRGRIAAGFASPLGDARPGPRAGWHTCAARHAE
jgi:hypothetical protein